MKKYLALVSLIIFLSSCSKSSGDDTGPIEPPVTKVSTINLINPSSGSEFSQIQILYKNVTINNYNLNASGNVKITFHGFNGRSMLGDHIGTTNIANFKIQNGDTVRIVKDGVKTDYTTDIWDGINGGISFSANSSETATQSVTRFNNYVNTVMPTQTFKGVY